ncbi:hypothetical protein F6I18_10200 [Corynebacterium amycolatum]|uniref:hypothetical protein n=1 Tax=Corynebacterium TaxID=1716 RepID=UPI0012B6BB09|nr:MULTISPECIES: hypothetical protein [Corynebacterium]KAA9267526.1 hypothetical protein F6I18_10200 [Corynebacterium amycolatum]MBC6793069.1 hypothetical protein [Corynebacterium sp. LK26]MBU5624186.1 hypothetical protein [Corynebacterium amycolatum]
MDVTPIVEVLEAMPSGPTVNVTFEINPTIDGDLTLLETGDWNAPFGRDFMDINITNDQSTTNDNSTHVSGVEADSADESLAKGEEAAESAEEADEAAAAPKSLFNGSPSLPGIGV